MTTVRFHTPDKPTKRQLDSVMLRASLPLQCGILAALPVITQEPVNRFGFWPIILTVNESDKPFWLGFVAGLDYAQNNPATVGATHIEA